MKKIEEKYLESEHQVRAYDVYLSSYRVKGANRVLAIVDCMMVTNSFVTTSWSTSNKPTK